MTFCKSSCLTHLVIIKLTLFCSRVTWHPFSFLSHITPFIFHLYITTDPFYSPRTINMEIMKLKLICTHVTSVLLPFTHLLIIPLSPVHHTEPFETFPFYQGDDNSSLCFVTYSHPLLIHHTTPFTSNPSSFPCIYTYMSKKKTVLNTERS